MRINRGILCTAALVVFVFAKPSQGQQPILRLADSGWGNTGIQTTPPAAFVVSVGFCVTGPNCNSSGNGMSNLNPLTFYPSGCPQRVKIYSGAVFDAIASVFAQSGNITYWVPRVLSNDGSVPPNFFQSNQGDGGEVVIGHPSTITYIEIALGGFTFQPFQIDGGEDWQLVGADGTPPPLQIAVF